MFLEIWKFVPYIWHTYAHFWLWKKELSIWTSTVFYFERLWTDIQINLCNSNITLQISMLFMNRCCHTHPRYKSYFYLKDQRHLLSLFQPKKEHYCIITETLLTAINFDFFVYIKLCINTLIDTIICIVKLIHMQSLTIKMYIPLNLCE